MGAYDSPVERALAEFWGVRDAQMQRQIASGRRDAGTRGAVTGGGHLNPVADLIVQAVAAPNSASVHTKGPGTVLPGYYRPSKRWDIVWRQGDEVIAAIELKSMVGSFGNNMNNRTEEALGNGIDIRAANEHGLVRSRPWLGYVYVMQEADRSRASSTLGHGVDPAFRHASYLDRLAILGERLVSTALYDACWVVATSAPPDFAWSEPDAANLGFERFTSSLSQHLAR